MPDLFLRISLLLNELPDGTKYMFHMTRYKFFYENSRRGHDCIYCVRTREMFWKEKEKEALLAYLSTKPLKAAYQAIELLGEINES